MVAIFAIFYFVMIGPERKNRKKREAMLKAMKKGDEVMTSGGIYGTIAAIHENEITLQLSDSVRVRFARQAIQEVLSGNSSSEPAKS
ncbi:MAG: preprotein translocase subunit YajC [Planctomycetes bacterium]|nr:preprotein translocase subunit YajC [Planctomycetota bacterium]